MWEPISLTELSKEIYAGEIAMKPNVVNLWHLIRISPVKWQEQTHGEEGGGFWVVAIYGQHVIWYNDIEDGFNTSTYQLYGKIDEYYSNQDPLDTVISQLLNFNISKNGWR